MIGCRCGASWPGTRISHCSSCHETFSSVSAFDAHRRKAKSETSKYVGRCLYPPDASLSLVAIRAKAGKTLLVWMLPARERPAHWRTPKWDGHDIDAGGFCRKPGCAWYSDHEEERFHTDPKGNRL